MPARVDVFETRLVFYTSEYTKVGGLVVNDTWAEAHLENAGLAAGLDVGASDYPSLTAGDLRRLEVKREPPPLDWNAVDAADRIQRAAYALATGGVPDPSIEARLSRLRGPIVRVLLGRDALRSAEEGNWSEAKEMAATPLPLAPGPFPRRAYAVIELADALADEHRRPAVVAEALREVNELLERRLALMFAECAGGAPHSTERGVVAWPEVGAFDIHRWVTKVVEPLLGPMEPPDAPLVNQLITEPPVG